MDEINSKKHKHNSGKKEKGVPNAPLHAKNEPAKGQGTQTPAPNKKDEGQTEPRNRVLDIFTGVLVFVGIVQIFVNVLLWNETKKSEDAAKSSSDAAWRADSLSSQSLQLTQRSINLAEKNFTVENRPYLYVENFAYDPIETAKKVTGKIVFRNYGKTPAFRYAGSTFVTVTDTPYITSFANWAILKKSSISILSPSAISPLTLQGMPIMDESLISEINRQRKFLFVYGKTEYFDIFNKKYIGTFCFIYSATIKEFIYYDKYNEDIFEKPKAIP